MGATVRGRWRGPRALVMMLAVGLATSPAAAQPGAPPPPQAVELLFERGPGAEHCPDEAALREAVAARIGRDPFAAPSADGDASDGSTARPLVRVAFDRVGRRINARVEMQAPSGSLVSSRELSERATRCDELVLALAVSLAVTFDIDSAETARAQRASLGAHAPSGSVVMTSMRDLTRPSAATSGEPSRAEIRSRRAARAPPSTATRWPAPPLRPRLRVLASGGVQVGAQPGPAAALLAGTGVRLRWASVLGELRFATGVRVETADGGGASTTWAGGALGPCAHVDRWGLCVVGEVARLKGRGFGVAEPREDSVWLVSAGLSGIGEWWVARTIALHARAELALPVVTADVRLDDRTVWQAPSWKLTAALGVTFETR